MTERVESVDIAKSARMLEWLRAELVGNAAGVLRQMLTGNEAGTIDALAGSVIASYLLARRLGVPFAVLENQILARLQENVDSGHEAEEWYGDLSALADYFQKTRGFSASGPGSAGDRQY